MVSDSRDIDRFAELGRKRGEAIPIHLKLDTGMGRLGLGRQDFDRALELTKRNDGICVSGISTHFANADIDDANSSDSKTVAQIQLFEGYVKDAKAQLEVPLSCHAANSAGALRFSRSRFDACRVGIAMYGGSPDQNMPPQNK